MARPFRFDTQFPPDSVEPRDSAPSPPNPADFVMGGFTEEDLEAVRDRAYRQGLEVGDSQGFDRGQVAARQAAEVQAANALAAIEGALRTAVAGVAAFQGQLERDTVRIVTTLVGRLAPPLLEAVAEAELDNLILETLAAAVGRPTLEIRLHPQALERIAARMERLKQETGCTAVVALLPDPGLPLGAAIADWGTGGAIRDPRLIERQLADAVAIAVSRLTLRTRA